MAQFLRVGRRMFLAHLGKGAVAMLVLGACADGGSSSPTTSGESTSSTAAVEDRFQRVNLGFVSAYIVVRGSEAAIVDTGVSGSQAAIEAALGEVGLEWSQVGHVILTHRHPDHVGSVSAVVEVATGATGYAGEADLSSINSPRELSALTDGDQVFGLDVIGTPGHTAGHISLLDPVAGVLVAGDAVNGANGGVIGPTEEFSTNHDEALRSVEKLAGFRYEQILFGHGEPVLAGGSAMVAELAESL